MTKPTKKAILKELNKLIAMKPRIHQHSAFGDDHHAAIDAQVEVLQGNLSENDIYRLWDQGEDRRNVLEGALYARRWMDEGEEKPSDDWASLVKP